MVGIQGRGKKKRGLAAADAATRQRVASAGGRARGEQYFSEIGRGNRSSRTREEEEGDF